MLHSVRFIILLPNSEILIQILAHTEDMVKCAALMKLVVMDLVREEIYEVESLLKVF